jgi:hypothetical protein
MVLYTHVNKAKTEGFCFGLSRSPLLSKYLCYSDEGPDTSMVVAYKQRELHRHLLPNLIAEQHKHL